MAIGAGQQLRPYRLIEKIGEGGMGVVWKALDTSLDREVAIKILPENVAADSERIARFEREAKLLASLNHPNVATVYGVHEAEGKRFLAMELVPGEDLAVRLRRGRMDVAQATPYGVDSLARRRMPRSLASACSGGSEPRPCSASRYHRAAR